MDLLQLFWAQFHAQATPVLIQFGKAQETHLSFRQSEPLWWVGQNKSTGIVLPSKGHIWIVDVLQNKNEVVMSSDLSRIEVSW